MYTESALRFQRAEEAESVKLMEEKHWKGGSGGFRVARRNILFAAQFSDFLLNYEILGA